MPFLHDPQNRELGYASPANETCENCALSRKVNSKMPGFDYNCVYYKSNEYHSRYARCFFEPSRFVAKKATIVLKGATV